LGDKEFERREKDKIEAKTETPFLETSISCLTISNSTFGVNPMRLAGHLKGTGTLVRDDQRTTGVLYDIEIWSADSGMRSARGTLSVTIEAGPYELFLSNGNKLNVFVTTAGLNGSKVLVKDPVPNIPKNI
jgi:hypothetical protein